MVGDGVGGVTVVYSEVSQSTVMAGGLPDGHSVVDDRIDSKFVGVHVSAGTHVPTHLKVRDTGGQKCRLCRDSCVAVMSRDISDSLVFIESGIHLF